MFQIVFQIPAGTPTDYATGANLILWEIVVLLLFIMLPMGYFAARKQTEFRNLRISELGQGWFGFFYALARLFFIIAVVFNSGKNYDEFTNIAYLCSMIGLTMLIYTYEHYRLGQKAPLFTLVGVFASFFTLSGFQIIPGFSDVPWDIILVIISIASTILLLLVASLYVRIMNRFPGQTRTRTGFEFIGLLLLVLGIIFDGQTFITNADSPWFFKMIYPPMLAIMGVSILIVSHTFPKWFYMSYTVFAVAVLFIWFFMNITLLRSL